MSITLVHTLLAAPSLAQRVVGSAPSPVQLQCLLLPGQIHSNPNCKQWRRTDNNNRAEECPTIAQVKEKK